MLHHSIAGFAPQAAPSGPSIADLINGGVEGYYYDITNVPTLFQDTAGTIPISADGQVIRGIETTAENINPVYSDDGFRQFNNASEAPIYRTDGTLHWMEFTTNTVMPLPDGVIRGSSVFGYGYVDTTELFMGMASGTASSPWILPADDVTGGTTFKIRSGDSIGTVQIDDTTHTLTTRTAFYNALLAGNSLVAELVFGSAWPSPRYGRYATGSRTGFTKTTGLAFLKGPLDQATRNAIATELRQKAGG
jgi:hypothetical protein